MVTSQPTKIHSDLVVPQQVLWKKLGPFVSRGKSKFSHCAFQLMALDAKCLKNTWVIISYQPHLHILNITVHCRGLVLYSASNVSVAISKKSGYSLSFVVISLVSYVRAVIPNPHQQQTTRTVTRCSTKVLFVDQKWNDLSTVKLLYIVSSHGKINCWKCAFSFHPLSCESEIQMVSNH